MSILAKQLVANKTRRGKLVAIAVHPERYNGKDYQLVTECDCGGSRIVTVSAFKRFEVRACRECNAEKHRETLRLSYARRAARKTSHPASDAHASQVEALFQQRKSAYAKLGVRFDEREMRAAILHECREYDFSDLLKPEKFELQILRGSSLGERR